MTEFRLEEAMAILERTPAVLHALLGGLPDVWVNANEGPGTWSAFDIVGHLVVGERTDWMVRVRSIVTHGETRAFDPFDRFAQQKTGQGKTLEELLAEFALLRGENLAALRALHLNAGDLDLRGRHPVFGGVTLAQLLATWTAHDMNHLHQLARVMASQYREAVGPWKAYLGVMKCEGHSDS